MLRLRLFSCREHNYLKRLRSISAVLILTVMSGSTARAQDKAVYYDGNYGTNLLQESASKQMRDYFASIGYKEVDAAELKTFMHDHVTRKTPSVVIMARDAAPDTVVNVESDSVASSGNVIVDYLNNSGRVVQIGDTPFNNIALSSEKERLLNVADSGARTLLGISGTDTATGCTNDDFSPVTLTDEGKNEGLTEAWYSLRVVPSSSVDVVLAESAESPNVESGCAAGWIKKFPNSLGLGEYIRLYDRTIESFSEADLKSIRNVAEFNLPTSSDTEAPAAITDLKALLATLNSVTLRFTAPTDTGAGSAGMPSGYEIRYSAQPITEENIHFATRAGGNASVTAGGVETFPVTGLARLQNYYFTVISHDAAGNASALSNVATLTTGFAPSPTLPPVTDRAVYEDVNYPGAWIGATTAQSIHDYFTARGYAELQANGLATFMASHAASQIPSVVVMAVDNAPDTVIDLSGSISNVNFLNDYLNHGGRIVHYGDWPFYNVDRTGGGSHFLGPDGAETILGFNAAGGTPGYYDPVALTPSATALGLTSIWYSARPANPGDIDVSLASSKGGAAGWIKLYPSSSGPGFFARLVDQYPGDVPLTPAQLSDGQKIAEFSGVLPTDSARISGVTSPFAAVSLIPTAGGVIQTAYADSQGFYSAILSPGSYTLTARGITASGIAGATTAPTGPVNAELGKITEVSNLTLTAEALPAMAVPTDRAVYFAQDRQTSWVSETAAESIRDYFVSRGYTLVDAAGLAAFMTAHSGSKTPSAVVMAQDIYPDTVVDVRSGAVVAKNLLTDYLYSGGRTINFGDIPFYNISLEDSGYLSPGPGDGGAQTILGFNASSAARDRYDVTTLTPVAQGLGLTSTWVSQRPVESQLVDVVLGSVEGGKAAGGWIKFISGATRTGMFVRLIDTTLDHNSPDDYRTLSAAQLQDAQKLAEFGGPFPLDTTGGTGFVKGDLNGDGRVDVRDAILALLISVGSVIPTSAQLAAGDVANLGNGITFGDAIKILQVAIGGSFF